MARNPGPGEDFECLSPLGGEQARVKFRGNLGGVSVTWNATLFTLAAWARQAGLDSRDGIRQFIEVAAPHAGAANLTVGLAVPAIDLPAVRKTIIMIRNYKRLAPGRHEYGEPLPPPEGS
jgi:hypothetical protein